MKMLSESLEVNYKHLKVTIGKRITKQSKFILFCKFTQMTIRSHNGYVRLVKKIIGGFWKSYKVKIWFSKEVEKCIPKYIFLNGYQSLMTRSRSAIFCMYRLWINKKTGLRGILPQCYINITKFCFKQHDFFIFFFLF